VATTNSNALKAFKVEDAQTPEEAYKILANIYNPDFAWKVKNLKWDRFQNNRELIYKNE